MLNISNLVECLGKLTRENISLKEEKVSLEIIISDLQEENTDTKRENENLKYEVRELQDEMGR